MMLGDLEEVTFFAMLDPVERRWIEPLENCDAAIDTEIASAVPTPTGSDDPGIWPIGGIICLRSSCVVQLHIDENYYVPFPIACHRIERWPHLGGTMRPYLHTAMKRIRLWAENPTRAPAPIALQILRGSP